MTLTEQEHESHSRVTVAALVAEHYANEERRQLGYLKTRHMVRVTVTIACFGVLLAGILVALFSG